MSRNDERVKSAQLMRVICVHIVRGQGTDNNPYRDVWQYWNFDGEFLAEHDVKTSRHPYWDEGAK